MTSVGRPAIRSMGGIHELHFHDVGIRVRVDRLSESSRHETLAEIKIANTLPGYPAHIHQARLNLKASTTRASMARNLMEKVELPWADILEFVCVMVLEAHRKGSPIVHLADHTMPEGLVFRLSPFLQERQPTVLFGEGDTGKSWLAILMGYLVATGAPKLGMEPEPGKVLYLDYETDEDTLWERLNMLFAGFDEPIPEGFFYRQMHQLMSADYLEINNLVMEHNIDLVIVDSAANAVGEPEASTATTEYFRALRSLRVSSLTIAHVSKGGKLTEPFGSIFWRNAPRANFRVAAEHEPGATGFTVGLKHTKSNNGRRLPDRAYHLRFGDGSVHVDRAEPTDIHEWEETRTTAQRIAAALRGGAMTTKELAVDLELTESNIRTTLNRNRNDLFTVVDTDPGGTSRWGNLQKDQR